MPFKRTKPAKLFLLPLFAVLLSIAPTQALLAASQDATPSTQASTNNSVTLSEIKKAQSAWADGLIQIGKVYTAHGDYQKTARDAIAKLYAYNYEQGTVLFKPTKAKDDPFRDTPKSALSYFVGHDADHPADQGFALAPWTRIIFHNDKVYRHGDIAIVMGTYDFTDAAGKTATVEYTFGYVKDDNGQLQIFLHHSSMPYQS